MGRIISFNGRYYDTGTANKSFLQLAKDLKTAGVKHWYFMLEIKDPTLIKVDPYAVNENGHTACTKDQIDRITLECVNNLWYYLREIARIPTAGKSGGVPYIANRGNIAQAWCLYNGIDSWLCLTRQQGKTKSALALQAWAYSFGTADTTFIFVNKDGENAKTNLRDLADQISCLPEYLRYESIMDEEGKVTKSVKNATRMVHPVTKNKIIVKSKAISYDSALSLARGLSASILHFDEPEFTPYIDVIVENSVSTFNTSAAKAKEAGAIYGRIFTCTPGDTDTDPGRRAEKLLARNAKWREEFYDMPLDEVKKEITADKKSGIVYIEYSYRQIGLTEEWFKEISAQIGNPLTVRREILLQRLRGSSASPWDRDTIEHIIEMAQKPIDVIMLQKYYRLEVYEKLNRNIPYLVGIDCATGTNSDSNAITIINPYTLKPVAEFECSYVGEPELIAIIKELVKKYIPRAILCIERNHVGDSIIAFLMQSEIAGRIYFDKGKELAEEQMKDLESQEDILKAKAKLKVYYGVYTERKSREVMFKILANRISDHQDEFVGQNITRDISKLVNKGGKIQAAEGWHDDSIMSYLIAMYVYFYGNNLEVFGFNKADLLYTEEHNKGMLHGIETADLYGLSDDVKEIVEDTYRKETKKNFEDVLREQLMRSQQEGLMLARRGLVNNELYSNSPRSDEDYYADFDSEDSMDIFDELNIF